MVATNHFVTGVAIGVAAVNPLLALPLAFASHFALDALPHYGEKFMARASGPVFKAVNSVDIVLLVICFAWLVGIVSPWAIVAGFVAMSPDFVWIYRFILQEKWGKLEPGPANLFNRFHAGIQWGERTWAWVFDVLYFGLIIYVVNGLV